MDRADPSRWLEAAYSDRSLVTQVGLSLADQAAAGDHPAGVPTFSSTLPGLIVRLGQHAHLTDRSDVLDVGTGSGYGCALQTARLGAEHVTSVDVDPYLTAAASERLDSVGLRATVLTADATSALPGDVRPDHRDGRGAARGPAGHHDRRAGAHPDRRQD